MVLESSGFRERRIGQTLNPRQKHKEEEMITKNRFKLTVPALALLCAVSLIAAPANAADVTGSKITETKLISTTRHVTNYFNAFGVCTSSTEVSTSVNQTTSVDKNGKETTSTTTTTQTSTSTWKGGSVKVDKIEGSSETKGSDDSHSKSESTTIYTYDEDGKLQGASGTGTVTGDKGKDANGEDAGTYSSTSTDTYIIKNGQALRSSTESNTTYYSAEDPSKEIGTSKDVLTVEYELKGGNWVAKTETTTSHNVTPGDTTQTTDTVKVKTYTRDETGAITGISQTMTGTLVYSGGQNYTYKLENYNATFKKDPKQGWYQEMEEYDWELQTS